MADEKGSGVTLSPSLIAQLRLVREQLLEQYHVSREAANLLPEQSLALRSQISYITSVVEPGIQEMWPDYSPTEKRYLEEQSLKRERGANDVAMAALGPFALPAIVADNAGAPPEVVSNLIEIGFNATAVLGLGRSGARHLRGGEVVPREPAEARVYLFELIRPAQLASLKRPPFVADNVQQQVLKVVPEIRNLPVDASAKNSEQFYASNQVTNINYFKNWRSSAREYYDAALKSGKEAEPILNWLVDSQIEKLILAFSQYGGGKGQTLSAIKDVSQAELVEINRYLDVYRSSAEGRIEAYKDAGDFEGRLLKDLADKNGELDPDRLRLVVLKLNAGEYMTARDYAALEQLRYLAHHDFVESKVQMYQSMNKYLKLPAQELQKRSEEVRLEADLYSPYAVNKTSKQNSDVSLPHNHDNDHEL